MSTIILNPRKIKELQPAYGLWQMYDPDHAPYRFQAKTIDEATAWQAKTRVALNTVVGFQNLPRSDRQPELIETVDRGDYIREKVLLYTTPYSAMPVYVLLPKTSPRPLPVMLALHGHGYGVKDILGLWEDGEERDGADGIYKDFGVALCRKGFAVAAPETSCFGERLTDFSSINTTIGQSIPASTCDHTSKMALHLGGSALGLRILDTKRLIDYLATRSDVDTQRLGAMGLSGGGSVVFFAAGLDERIKTAVISGYYSTFKDSLLAMHHCICNFIPGLHQFGEMYDLVGLLAPRPLLIESGSRDPIFPRKAVMQSVEIARSRVYQTFGCPQNVETDYFEGRHRVNGARAYDFLAEHLITV